MPATIKGPDGRKRCSWCSAAPDFFEYHDTEWGFPVGDDHQLFEKICLEGFQSGLSWRTILAKRDNFRAAFRDTPSSSSIAPTTRKPEKRFCCWRRVICRHRICTSWPIAVGLTILGTLWARVNAWKRPNGRSHGNSVSASTMML